MSLIVISVKSLGMGPSLTERHSSTGDFRLDGKVTVVTGGGSGLGGRLPSSLQRTVPMFAFSTLTRKVQKQLLGKSCSRASAYVCDLGDQEHTRAIFSDISTQARIHILVNNAGVSHIGTVENTGEEEFDRVLRVNVKGFYNCIHACIGHMKSKEGGVILNIASVAGSAGLADRFAYSTSKGAVIAMTYSVAHDYVAHNIRCNCISPARVHTPFVDGYLAKNYPGREQEMFARVAKSQPIGRMATAEEVASLGLFLCSDAASFITGVNYPVDGGFTNLMADWGSTEVLRRGCLSNPPRFAKPQ